MLFALALLSYGSVFARAADVDVRLSAREAYVGAPIQLQIQINNANGYEAPIMPNIDGVDIRSVGTPPQSSQISIINGRRTEKRNVTLSYLITPRREGTFTLPNLQMKV